MQCTHVWLGLDVYKFQIGEGSFGEVFLLPSLVHNQSRPVLKIVPVDGNALVNGDAQTTLEDMLAEITVSIELSRLATSGKAKNFVKVILHTKQKSFHANL